ncbi:MAG: hypothetical protein LAO78_20385 [Acidobacteriia bacterium]|jgi:hypothetical protein|nr:hypothetical protein [Terriglobia bacterium]
MRNSQSDDPASPSLDAIEDFVLGFAVLGFRGYVRQFKVSGIAYIGFPPIPGNMPQPLH